MQEFHGDEWILDPSWKLGVRSVGPFMPAEFSILAWIHFGFVGGDLGV